MQDITNCFKISVLHIPRVTLTLRYAINFIQNEMTRNYTSTLWILEHRAFPCWLFVGIYITAVTSQERLLFKKNFFGLKKCGFYSREVTKRERLLMARVRYIKFEKIEKAFLSICSELLDYSDEKVIKARLYVSYISLFVCYIQMNTVGALPLLIIFSWIRHIFPWPV